MKRKLENVAIQYSGGKIICQASCLRAQFGISIQSMRTLFEWGSRESRLCPTWQPLVLFKV